MQLHERRAGRRVVALGISCLQFSSLLMLLTPGQVAHHVLSLVPLASLHLSPFAENIAHGSPQTLGSVQHDQEIGVHSEATPLEISKEALAHRLVLARRLDEPKDALFPRDSHSEGDHERIVPECLPVEQEHYPLLVTEGSLLQMPQLARTGANETTRDAGALEPERLRHRLSGRLVVPA